MKEVPRTPGYRGERYSPEGEQSYYCGGREKVVVEGKQVERSRMSLEPREGTWEERVPAHAPSMASSTRVSSAVVWFLLQNITPSAQRMPRMINQ